MNDLCWNSKLLGAMKEHACLTEEEIIVLIDWVDNHWSIAKTGIERSMSDSKVEKYGTGYELSMTESRNTLKTCRLENAGRNLGNAKIHPHNGGGFLRFLYGKITFLCANFLLH